MILVLDTAVDDFALALLDNNYKLIDKIILKGYPKKVDLIPQYVKEICSQNGLTIGKIDSFITNLGPGYFTGVRISLVYLRTIALVSHAAIKTYSTMQIIRQQNPKKDFFVTNAMGNKYYFYANDKSNFDIKNIVIKEGIFENYDSINYEDFFNNFKDYVHNFKNYENLHEIEPYYIKLPQIGSKK